MTLLEKVNLATDIGDLLERQNMQIEQKSWHIQEQDENRKELEEDNENLEKEVEDLEKETEKPRLPERPYNRHPPAATICLFAFQIPVSWTEPAPSAQEPPPSAQEPTAGGSRP
ncbi:Circumsporozoite protein [Lasiodiplodia theobromae]|uniref:Circumsporozoite protein n=1 Tax=Lasiodiplodia theobromae TaxID=45133 RepID=UPI0015C3A9F2|nr:Circumsporozoite protein [Lasiodiplodia theobromae]KAF4544321.1 Circumsporozoite protein [Lasiodiplodia theobromae]